jgi:hypothetical protein
MCRCFLKEDIFQRIQDCEGFESNLELGYGGLSVVYCRSAVFMGLVYRTVSSVTFSIDVDMEASQSRTENGWGLLQCKLQEPFGALNF